MANEIPGFFTLSLPLPKDHWIYGYQEHPPMPFRTGVGQYVFFPTMTREGFLSYVQDAAKYAVQKATMSGKDMDFDPDALLQNLCVGLCGYFTDDGNDTGIVPSKRAKQ